MRKYGENEENRDRLKNMHLTRNPCEKTRQNRTRPLVTNITAEVKRGITVRWMMAPDSHARQARNSFVLNYSFKFFQQFPIMGTFVETEKQQYSDGKFRRKPSIKHKISRWPVFPLLCLVVLTETETTTHANVSKLIQTYWCCLISWTTWRKFAEKNTLSLCRPSLKEATKMPRRIIPIETVTPTFKIAMACLSVLVLTRTTSVSTCKNNYSNLASK